MPNKLTASLVFILTAIFYISSLLPSLAWGDGTKLQSEAIAGESFVLAEMPGNEFVPDPFPFSKVGVAAWDHPLYIVLGHTVVKLLPFIDSLWLINFISAIFGAVSVLLVFILCYRFTGSLLAAVYAALSLAVSHTFWWHSSTPEVYTLFVSLLLLSFYFFDRFERTKRKRAFYLSTFFLGLAACTHIMAFLILPALGFQYISSGSFRSFRISDLKKAALPTAAFLAGFSLYILQFLRMSANFPLAEIMGPVVGSTFLSQLGSISPILLSESILTYLFFLTVQFGPVGLIFGATGIFKIYRIRDGYSKKIIFSFIVFAVFGIFYRVTDQFTFFITSYVFWSLLMGIGANYIFNLLPVKRRFLFPAVLGVFLIATPFVYTRLPGWAERYGVNDETVGIPKIGTGVRNGLAYYMNPFKKNDTSAYDFGRETVSNLAPNSVVIAGWYTDTDEYFIFRYFIRIKELRTDVSIEGWANQEPFNFDSQLALDVIAASFPERPVYLASLSDKFYAASKLVEIFCILPENNLYRLYQRETDNSHCLESDSVTE